MALLNDLLKLLIVVSFLSFGVWALMRWSKGSESVSDVVWWRAVFHELQALAPSRSVWPSDGEQPNADTAALGRSLCRSFDGEKTWYSKTLNVSGGAYVLFTNPVDYLKLCSRIDDFVGDVMRYLDDQAKSGAITLVPQPTADGKPGPFELQVVQILSRHHVTAGKPYLSAYATARAEEITREQTSEFGMKWQAPQEVALLDPHQIPGAGGQSTGINPLTGTTAEPVAPAQTTTAGANAGDQPTHREPSPTGFGGGGEMRAASVLLAPDRTVAHLEVVDLPAHVEMSELHMTLTNGAVYGRSSDLGEVAIPSEGVSRKQFQLHREYGGWWLEDLAGTTAINGASAVGRVRLHDNDRIELAGEVVLAVHLPIGDLPTSR